MARPPAIETETALWLALNIQSIDLTDEQFIEFCENNPEYRFEVSANKELIIMSPNVPSTSEKNVILTTALRIWTEHAGGHCYGQDAMFTLPNGAWRSP